MENNEYLIELSHNGSVAKRMIRYLVDILLKPKYHLRLIPNQDFEASDDSDDSWNAIGESPMLLLGGHLPNGWSRMMIAVRSSQHSVMGLRLDRNHGFEKGDFYPIGSIGPELTSYSVYVASKSPLRAIRLEFTSSPERFVVKELNWVRVSRLEILLGYIKVQKGRYTRVGVMSRFFKYVRQVGIKEGLKAVWQRIISEQTLPGLVGSFNAAKYAVFLEKSKISESDRQGIIECIAGFEYHPKISIMMPVYNTSEQWLRAAIHSVTEQIYTNWELCIADDASTATHIQGVLTEYARIDDRIKTIWRNERGHIADATNSALYISSGDFVATLDHDDVLTADALYEVVKLLNRHPDADMVYSDEDKISDTNHRHSPYFKPDWSPDLFLSQMYTAHLAVYRRSLVNQIGGYRSEFAGAQDYDLVLRLTEITSSIYHIPKVLYSWRVTEGSTASSPDNKHYAYEAAYKALNEAIERREGSAEIVPIARYPGHFQINWQLAEHPLISIIILTKDNTRLLKKCISSIFSRTEYDNFEILVIDNGSKSLETLNVLKQLKQEFNNRFQFITVDIPFNFAYLNNYAADNTNGEILLFLNDDTEVISPSWLYAMAAQAQRPEIGAVGAMLLYPDYTIQHAGIILGINGWAGHSHKSFPSDSPGYAGRLLGPSNYAAVTGACLMIERKVFKTVGGFDEKLAISGNDVDLCISVYNKGYYNIVLPDIRLIHYESVTRGYEDTIEKQERFQKEVLYVKEKWQYLMQRDPFYNPNLTCEIEDFSFGFYE